MRNPLVTLLSSLQLGYKFNERLFTLSELGWWQGSAVGEISFLSVLL
jgi:hypothetical protein